MHPLLFWGHLALVILAAVLVLVVITLAGCSHPCGMFLSPDGKHVYNYRCNGPVWDAYKLEVPA